MNARILATSPLVGPALKELGAVIAPFRSAEWNAALPEVEALVVLLSEPLTESDLAKAPKLKAIATYSVGVNHLPSRPAKREAFASSALRACSRMPRPISH